MNLKNLMQFIKKIDKQAEIPIARQNAAYIDDGHIMIIRVSSRIPGRSFVGLPIDKALADKWVPVENLCARLTKDVGSVEYRDYKLIFDWGGGLITATMVYDDYKYSKHYNIKTPQIFQTRQEGDYVFRTT